MFQEPRSRLNVTSLRIQSNILNRFVRTRVLRNLKNPTEDFVEETILTLLPEEALVSDLTLEIDGKKYVGKSEEKETAWEIYIGGKNRGELPATVTMG
ncbi:unnamed protein product [Timema podura]|uniref:VIT domain-containing protein n=1 Tax=Timema podura TaxID=61482 RepID=A0ABN7PNN3_TIMPD|nr:unnamed protein product [Timema podura]